MPLKNILKNVLCISERWQMGSKTFSVIVDGFNTEEEAEEFIAWYGDQGEEDIVDWMADAKAHGRDIRSNYFDCDVCATYPLKIIAKSITMKLTPAEE